MFYIVSLNDWLYIDFVIFWMYYNSRLFAYLASLDSQEVKQ